MKEGVIKQATNNSISLKNAVSMCNLLEPHKQVFKKLIGNKMECVQKSFTQLLHVEKVGG